MSSDATDWFFNRCDASFSRAPAVIEAKTSTAHPSKTVKNVMNDVDVRRMRLIARVV